ncbi:uncharacterized protein si:dkey-246e1.3 isoform X3 [Girardinichthys multiradiatus]|uniref:uncharacterized protein si:dkey-246e1.3 isoform X3 n=1 Tax=Girardinichthys multiradiatus TaxID=208333 RepID=UPI001FADD3A0|nr:uncharacterized protein si:dkey-246e1.3 isoform X3 [Girardinichthys multiradiatus]
MSGAQEDGALMAQSLRLNRTAGFELQDREVNASMFEDKAFKIVIIGLALFILTVTGLYCISICYSRNRIFWETRGCKG